MDIAVVAEDAPISVHQVCAVGGEIQISDEQVKLWPVCHKGEFLPCPILQRVDIRFEGVFTQVLCQRHGILQLVNIQLTGHCLERRQFPICIQHFETLRKLIDLLHAGVSHIYEGPHLRHGGVAFLQLHLLPAIHLQTVQHGVQLRLLCGQVQLYGTDITDTEEMDHIRRLSWRPAQVGRSLPQLGFPYYIAVRGHSAVFVPAHFFTDLGIVQQLQHTIRYLFQFRQELVLHIEPAQCLIVPDPRHHMASIYAVRQIQQPLEGQVTAVGLAQLVDLHLHQPFKGDILYTVECTQLLRQCVELIQVAVVKERSQKSVPANVLHLPIGVLPIL